MMGIESQIEFQLRLRKMVQSIEKDVIVVAKIRSLDKRKQKTHSNVGCREAGLRGFLHVRHCVYLPDHYVVIAPQ